MLILVAALKLSLCQRQFQEYWRSPISGRYVPRCVNTGSFDDVQCFGPYCFCTDSNGIEIYGTRLLQTAGIVNCTDLSKSSWSSWKTFDKLWSHIVREYFV